MGSRIWRVAGDKQEELSIKEVGGCLERDGWHGEGALFLLLVELFWGGFDGD